jgi:hypothetical protein
VAGASIGSSSQPVGPHVDKHSGVVNSNRENNFTGSAEARPSSGKDDCEGENEERDGDWLAAKGDVFGESGLQIKPFLLLNWSKAWYFPDDPAHHPPFYRTPYL